MGKSGSQQKVAVISFLVSLTLYTGMEWGARAEAEIPKIPPGEGWNAAQGRDGKEKYVTMNFRDVDIHVLIQFISELTDRNFLVDPEVRGRVTILSPQEVTLEEAYRVFLSVLEMHGYTAVPAGRVIKIIKSADARARGVEIIREKGGQRPSDQVITQLVPLKHGAATDFAKVLRPLIPNTGLMIPYPDTNTLIIIDTAFNVGRILEIISTLDVPGARGKIGVFSLEHADAEKLAKKLETLFQPLRKGAGVGGMVKIIPEERTNSIIVLTNPPEMQKIEAMLEKLDQKVTQRRGGIHLYHLENAVAEDVAEVLGKLPGRGQEKRSGRAASSPAPISKDVHISGDRATNTLVIIADPEEYKILEEIIRRLDIPRTLVYVEALIMEVSANKALDLGVEWRAGDEYRGGLQPGGSGGAWTVGSQSGKSAIRDFAEGKSAAGFTAGVVGKAITLGGVTFPSISAFVRAVRTDSDFNVISTPQILTLDNEEAVIEVGQNIPYVTSVVEQGAITDRPIQNFEYRDVGVTLKVTPHLNSNETIKLQVEQSIKNVVDKTAGAGILAPTTTYRSTRSTITVGNGETAVVGGLVEAQMSRGKTQTPCLGGVPAFGWAFKQVADKDDKKNLMVFLTPHIIGAPEEGRSLYGDKRDYIDTEMEKAMKRNQPEELRRRAYE